MGGWRAYMAARNKNTDVKEVEAKKADGGAGKAAAEQKQPGGGGVGEVAKAMGFVALGAAAGFGFFKATAKK